MKLRNLRGAIRKQTGGVATVLPTPFGEMKVGLLKNELIAALTERYGEDETTETGIILVDGVLRIDKDNLDVWRGVSKPDIWATPQTAAPTPTSVEAEDDGTYGDDGYDFLDDVVAQPAPAAQSDVEDFL